MKNIKFNRRQVEFIQATDDNIVVTAPPGSGKTLSIVGAVKEYQKHNPKDHIVAITFTKKATEELRNRIRDSRIEVSTIHSWSYRQLQKYAAKYEFSVEMLDDTTIQDILQRLCRKRKHYYLNKYQLFHFVMGNYNIDVDDAIKRIFITIAADYTRYKRENNLYDFTDLPLYLFDVLEFYKEEITEIDAIFVDEFQDVDSTQVAIFDKVICKKKVFIGDPKQSIYIFRQSIEDLSAVTAGFSPYQLDTNYRSYQEIIDFADWARQESEQNLLFDLGTNFPTEEAWYQGSSSSIFCERGNGGKVFVVAKDGVAHPAIAGEGAERSAIELLGELVQDIGTQILVRSNKQVKRLEALGMKRVSTVHQAKGLEYKNVILVTFDITSTEELNVMYVAMTRAMDTLTIIDFEMLKSLLARLNHTQEELAGDCVRKLF